MTAGPPIRACARECRVLVTGFGAFPGAPFNPTTRLAQDLVAVRRPGLANVVRIAHVFETSYTAVEQGLPALFAEVRPNVVLLFGLAMRTPYLRVETRARNRRSPVFADARGCHPACDLITPGASRTMRGNAPHHRLATAARAAGVPVRLSFDAGSYLCNYVYWRALELTIRNKPLVQFVHVPLVRHRAEGGGITFDDLIRVGVEMLMILAAVARD